MIYSCYLSTYLFINSLSSLIESICCYLGRSSEYHTHPARHLISRRYSVSDSRLTVGRPPGVTLSLIKLCAQRQWAFAAVGWPMWPLWSTGGHTVMPVSFDHFQSYGKGVENRYSFRCERHTDGSTHTNRGAVFRILLTIYSPIYLLNGFSRCNPGQVVHNEEARCQPDPGPFRYNDCARTELENRQVPVSSDLLSLTGFTKHSNTHLPPIHHTSSFNVIQSRPPALRPRCPSNYASWNGGSQYPIGT